jgi:hypothetical protein
MHRGKFKSSEPGINSTHYTSKPVIWPKQQAFAGTYSKMPSNKVPSHYMISVYMTLVKTRTEQNNKDS